MFPLEAFDGRRRYRNGETLMTTARALFTISSIRRTLAPAILLAAAAACSSNSSSLAPVQRVAGSPHVHHAGSPHVHHAGSPCPASVVYVVTISTPTIEIFDRAHLHAKPCGTITGFQAPYGLFVDSKGNLWVADAFAQKVYEFTPGTNLPAQTLSDPNGQPIAVVINEATQTAYVTEYQNNVNPTTLVEIYANGSTVPTGSLNDPFARNGGSDAIDKQGNLYVTFMTQSNTAQVDRWTHGTGTPANLQLKGLISAGAIVTTASGALAICDPFAFRCGIYEQGSRKMTHVFGHMGRGAGIMPDKAPFIHPDALALERDEAYAFVLAPESFTMWAYPGPMDKPNHLPSQEVRLPAGGGDGIAVNPASRPGAPY
jgi:hypothetical protein